MKLEQSESSFLFKSTSLPDIFFTEYISEAPGDYIKVYLYCLFLSKYSKEIKLNDLSKKLSLPLKVIQEALAYWENKEIITKKGNGFIVNNIQEIGIIPTLPDKICPNCGNPMIIRRSRFGKLFYGCSTYPACSGILDLD